MPTIQIDKEQLVNAALTMSRRELEEFVGEIFSRKIREETHCLSEVEADLLMKINRGLPSASQERLNELIEKRQAETINAKELRELRGLNDQAEKFDVERLKLLTELAILRQVSLRKLIRHLGLKPVPHD